MALWINNTNKEMFVQFCFLNIFNLLIIVETNFNAKNCLKKLNVIEINEHGQHYSHVITLLQ